jgi:hypothetical protein
MTWRSTQLNQTLCDQDQLILNLFANKDVKYVGNDLEFKNLLSHSQNSHNLVLIINFGVWCSDIVDICQKNLVAPIQNFYIGINRYCIRGNDTNQHFVNTGCAGKDIATMLTSVVFPLGYSVTNSGHYDNDLGRHFNFVQPLTWVYGSKTNTGH